MHPSLALAHAKPPRGVKRERRDTFDAEALAEPEHDAEVRISETTDFHAERSRAKRPRRRKKG